MDDRRAWQEAAEHWVRWARTPGHDAYWHYRDAFFEKVVPPPGRVTLEVGCGEGRVTRDLVERGHQVVSVDASMALLGHAVDLDPYRRFLLADAAALPIADGTVDCAVAYNSLMDFDDMPGAVAEVARVLAARSTFSICITHPIFNTGRFDGEHPDAPYRLRGRYFGSHLFDATETKRGLSMRFRNHAHALEVYFAALVGAGLVVDALYEPVPAEGSDGYERWNRYPMFLHLRAVKTGAPPGA